MVQVEKQTNHLLVVYYFSNDVAAYISRPLILTPAGPFWNPVFVLLRLVKTITFRNGFVTPDPHWVLPVDGRRLLLYTMRVSFQSWGNRNGRLSMTALRVSVVHDRFSFSIQKWGGGW